MAADLLLMERVLLPRSNLTIFIILSSRQLPPFGRLVSPQDVPGEVSGGAVLAEDHLQRQLRLPQQARGHVCLRRAEEVLPQVYEEEL